MTTTAVRTATLRMYLEAFDAWLTGIVLRRRKIPSSPGQRRRLSLREEVSLRISISACIDGFEEYLDKHAAFDEYCRSHPAPASGDRA